MRNTICGHESRLEWCNTLWKHFSRGGRQAWGGRVTAQDHAEGWQQARWDQTSALALQKAALAHSTSL